MQLRRDRFIEEMESYTKQVEEFQTFGDMSEIQKYLRKAQALDNKLQAAAEKVGIYVSPPKMVWKRGALVGDGVGEIILILEQISLMSAFVSGSP